MDLPFTARGRALALPGAPGTASAAGAPGGSKGEAGTPESLPELVNELIKGGERETERGGAAGRGGEKLWF